MSVEQLLPSLFRIEVPLPKNPLKALNCYVITGQRNLIVDTGMNREECRSAIAAGLRELEIDLRESDIFLTHMHADHSGLAPSLATETSRVYCSQPDADRLNSDGRWTEMASFARLSGFPEGELLEAMARHPGHRHGMERGVRFSILKEGDTLSCGDYSFRCIETPGHTRGHLCLYEADAKLLIAGDHVLHDITPNISLWSDAENPLQQYLESLDKVYQLDVELALPGHRRIIREFRERIRQLQHHHQGRAEEILSLLEKGPMNAYQVASQMGWDMTYDSWERFPVAQKWFATGEAIAHLKYLDDRKLAHKESLESKILFSRS